MKPKIARGLIPSFILICSLHTCCESAPRDDPSASLLTWKNHFLPNGWVRLVLTWNSFRDFCLVNRTTRTMSSEYFPVRQTDRCIGIAMVNGRFSHLQKEKRLRSPRSQTASE